MRRVLYLTGTRADFGLMQSTLQRIHASPELELGLLVTGMHLDAHYGNTVCEVEASGLPIVARQPVTLRGDDGTAMNQAFAETLLGATGALTSFRPDILLLLGDRGEMLAGAVAALHLSVPVAHMHGGERSGTVDESIRHAISKLSHFHFAATAAARERLIRMGEEAGNVHVTGAVGLDGLRDLTIPDRQTLFEAIGFDPVRPAALVAFHAVVQQADQAGEQANALMAALSSIAGLQALVLMPNADAGGERIRTVFAEPRAGFAVKVHLSREQFCYWLARADVLVGNSSSGIIEAASFDTPVVNVGDRQFRRERSANVRDVPGEQDAIANAVKEVLASGRRPVVNVYGDGHSAPRVVKLLETLPITPQLMMKSNVY